jgi:hypothetical protein
VTTATLAIASSIIQAPTTRGETVRGPQTQDYNLAYETMYKNTYVCFASRAVDGSERTRNGGEENLGGRCCHTT